MQGGKKDEQKNLVQDNTKAQEAEPIFPGDVVPENQWEGHTHYMRTVVLRDDD